MGTINQTKDGYTPVVFWIKDEDVPRYRDGLAAHFGYREVDEHTGEANTESKTQYVKRKVIATWRGWVKRAEMKALAAAIEETEPIDIAED